MSEKAFFRHLSSNERPIIEGLSMTVEGAVSILHPYAGLRSLLLSEQDIPLEDSDHVVAALFFLEKAKQQLALALNPPEQEKGSPC